ncbi:hypothetical protein [Pseudotabrizicola formosa]|uniref:hypothetical protein n=1 Tax=Pseudotabrizicola formosa TaxID=2030009 RepID=UPI000CD1D67B|nr:hypothetical protein [Pseudotabrizicola formosa]
MQSLDLAKELAEVRAQILKLKRRELQLQKELLAADGMESAVRPGWPIRRKRPSLTSTLQ